MHDVVYKLVISFFKTLKCTWGTNLNKLFLPSLFHYPKDTSDWRIKTLNQTFKSRYKNLKSYKVPKKEVRVKFVRTCVGSF
jgi:hypothetical protein